ncbi:MAG: GNAT family N-acetyltransferase [Anaerolineales bacterium]|nr:GNAT family N-acetyltransferase [Anaerolineales bacterium]
MTQSDQPLPQLRMLWHGGQEPPPVRLPTGYLLRTYRPGDEQPFYALMELAGWPGWDALRLAPWRARMLENGWFMIDHTASGQLVAAAMALTDMGEFGQVGGELGWVAAHPDHRGRGLGLAVSAAATARMIQQGYPYIHLYTEDYRLAALKTYLRLGYRPIIEGAGMEKRWQMVHSQLENSSP